MSLSLLHANINMNGENYVRKMKKKNVQEGKPNIK